MKKRSMHAKGHISIFLFLLLSVCGIWLLVKGLLIKMFNSNSLLYHMAYEIDHDPFLRYGILGVYCISTVIFFLERNEAKKKIRVTFFILASILVIPLYTHIVINEYKMETAPIDKITLSHLHHLLDYAFLVKYSYNEDTKSMYVTLNYGTNINNIREEYLSDDQPLTNITEHQIKQRLSNDLYYVIHEVWSQTHQPKQIIFNVKWGKDAYFTTIAQKRERYLSYFDNDESDAFHENKMSMYYHIDVVEEDGNYVIKLKNDNENWVKVP